MSPEEKEEKRISRRKFVKGAAAAGVGAGVLAACGSTPAPQIVKETVEVPVEIEKIVKETVEVEKIVEVAGEAPAAAGEAVYEVYPPYGVPTAVVAEPNARLDTLDGKTICGIMGAHFHFEETFPVIAELLKRKYPTSTWIGPRDMEEMGGLQDYLGDQLELVEELVTYYKCDAVIVGNGC